MIARPRGSRGSEPKRDIGKDVFNGSQLQAILQAYHDRLIDKLINAASAFQWDWYED